MIKECILIVEMSDKAKEAQRKYKREWYKNNRDRVNEYRRKYYQSNKEKYQRNMARYWERKADEYGIK